MIDEIGDLEGLDIMDVATGVGTTALMLAKRCRSCRVVGLGFEDARLDIAKERSRGVKNLEYVKADMDYFGTSTGRFDVAVSSFTIGNFNDPIKAIGEMHRILKQGGRLFLLDINKPHNRVLNSLWAMNYALKVNPLLSAGVQKEATYFDIRRIRVDRDNLVEILKGSGFNVKRVRSLSFGTAFVITAEKI